MPNDPLFVAESAEQSRFEGPGQVVPLLGPVDAETQQRSRPGAVSDQAVEVNAESGEDRLGRRSKHLGVVGHGSGVALAVASPGVLDAVAGHQDLVAQEPGGDRDIEAAGEVVVAAPGVPEGDGMGVLAEGNGPGAGGRWWPGPRAPPRPGGRRGGSRGGDRTPRR